MELLNKARYYDGHSSSATTVNVQVVSDGIRFYFLGPDNNVVERYWPKNAIREIERSSSIITLQHGQQFPYEQLEMTDPALIAAYGRLFPGGILTKAFQMRGATWFITLLLVLGGFLALCYFLFLPLLADQVAKKFPKDYEISMGEELMQAVLENEEIDSARTRNANLFFEKMMEHRMEYPVKITVVNSQIPNAFAMPGGGIVVYTAILDSMKSYEALAGLLAHEYSHVLLRHTVRNLFRSLAGSLFISMVFGDMNGVSSVLVNNAHQLRNLKYSRTLESEADQNAMLILREHEINIDGMSDLFRQLKKENSIEINEWFSSHPDLSQRISDVEAFKSKNPYTAKEDPGLKELFEKLKNWD